MTINEIVAHNIRWKRESLRMTRWNLAVGALLSLDYIEAMENGRRIPSLSALDRIAKALGVTASDLLREV